MRADLSIVLALGAVSAVAHLLAAALLWIALGIRGDVLTGLWLVTPLAAVGVLWWMLALGALAGVLLPSVAAPYVVGALCLGLPMVWSKIHVSTLFLLAGGGTLTSPEFEFVPRSEVVGAQGALGAGALLIAAAITAVPSRVFLLLIAAGVLIAAPAAWFLQNTTPTRFWADTTSLAVTCVPGEVTMCVPEERQGAGQILAAQVERLNSANSHVRGFVPIRLVRAVSFGTLQRQSQDAPRNEQWITVADFGKVPSWDFLVGHMEQLAYPTRCFTPSGPPPGALADSTMLFESYQSVLAAGLDPSASPALRPVTALSSVERDAWTGASWSAVYQCREAPDVPTS